MKKLYKKLKKVLTKLCNSDIILLVHEGTKETDGATKGH